MTASMLDRRIQFYRSLLIDDGFGMTEGPWQPLGSPVWALRQDVRDGEKWRSGQPISHVIARFQVRSTEFTRDIDPGDRLTCEGETFAILGIKQAEGRRQLIEITAVARTDD